MQRDYLINTFDKPKITANMAQLNYTTAYINLEWLIKVAGVNNEGKKINTLVGVSGLLALIGVDLANKFLDRAERCRGDFVICKLRRGLKVTFYRH